MFLALLAGCPVDEAREDEVYTAEIGVEGGELVGGGMTLTVPAGALSATETLTVRVSNEDAPDGGVSVSPVYRFEPEGLVFADDVHVRIDVEDGALATLLWSTSEDPDQFEEIGLAAGGIAEGYTTHFSTAFVGEGVCSVPAPTTVCTCRAGDAQADLLCPEDPSSGAVCDIDAYSGVDGEPCTGFGPRPVIASWCDCYNDNAGYLCPDPMIFEPSQECPSERGLNGFHGAPYEACSGYDIDNQQLSGTILACSVETADTVYEQLPGSLEGCYDSSSSSRGARPERCSTSRDSWTDECLDVLDAYGPDRTEACPGFGDPATTGSVIGAKIEKAWTLSAADGSRVSQLRVPHANKNDCRNTKVKAADRRYGNIDIAQVVARGNGLVSIRIGEVKPLTRSGLDLGWREVYECYADAVAAAGKQCTKAESAMTADELAFCSKLGAVGKEVVLDAQPGVVWTPTDPIPVKVKSGAKRQVDVQACTEGVVAYTCP